MFYVQYSIFALKWLFLVIIAGFFIAIKSTSKKSEINQTQVSTKENLYSSQTNSEGNIQIDVMPVNVSSDKKSWSFQITLTTHEGSLDEDLVKNSSLVDGEGNKLDPIRWEGADPGGHHSEGTLIFPSFSQTPKSVKLILRDIGEIPERSFIWNLDGQKEVIR